MNSENLKNELILWADTASQKISSTTNGLALQEAMRAQYLDDPDHSADCLSYKAFYGPYGCISLNHARVIGINGRKCKFAL